MAVLWRPSVSKYHCDWTFTLSKQDLVLKWLYRLQQFVDPRVSLLKGYNLGFKQYLFFFFCSCWHYQKLRKQKENVAITRLSIDSSRLVQIASITYLQRDIKGHFWFGRFAKMSCVIVYVMWKEIEPSFSKLQT